MKSTNEVEYIFLNRSLETVNDDLAKLSSLISSFSDEQCYEVEVKMESIGHKMLEVREKIKRKVLFNHRCP